MWQHQLNLKMAQSFDSVETLCAQLQMSVFTWRWFYFLQWGLPGQVRVSIVPSDPLTKIFVPLILTLNHFKERILPTDSVILPLLFLAKEATAVGFLQKRIGQGKCRLPWMITSQNHIDENFHRTTMMSTNLQLTPITSGVSSESSTLTWQDLVFYEFN